MEFTLTVDLKKKGSKLSDQMRREINRLLEAKKAQVGLTSRRTIKVLLTDSQHVAQAHDDEHDTITILQIDESSRVEGGIIASFADDVPANLKAALDRLHLIQGDSGYLVVK